MGDRVARWQEEEKRLRELVRTFKERAKYSPDWAKRANAMESRWQRWVDEGPPPAPVVDHPIRVRLRGADSARRVVDLRDVAIPGIVRRFSDEVHLGERVGLIGPNGSGKTHLIRLLAGEDVAHEGDVVLGNRVSAGLFTQLNARADFAGARRAGARDAPDRRPRARDGARWPATGCRTPRRAPTRRCRAASGRAWRSSPSRSRATTCCCSTSRRTTSTSSPPRRSRPRWTASRGRWSRSPTTARS